jgi:hypothetical protein
MAEKCNKNVIKSKFWLKIQYSSEAQAKAKVKKGWRGNKWRALLQTLLHFYCAYFCTPTGSSKTFPVRTILKYSEHPHTELALKPVQSHIWNLGVDQNKMPKLLFSPLRKHNRINILGVIVFVVRPNILLIKACYYPLGQYFTTTGTGLINKTRGQIFSYKIWVGVLVWVWREIGMRLRSQLI